MDSAISVPRPAGDALYIRLRDDPSIVSIAAPAGMPASTKSSSPPRRKPNKTFN